MLAENWTLNQAYLLLLAQNGGQAADLSSQSSAHMLRSVGYEVLNARHNVFEKNIAVNQAAESGDLASDGSANLGLVILEQLDKGRNQIARNNLLIDGLGNLHCVLVSCSIMLLFQ